MTRIGNVPGPSDSGSVRHETKPGKALKSLADRVSSCAPRINTLEVRATGKKHTFQAKPKHVENLSHLLRG